jgi:hypothetical protein
MLSLCLRQGLICGLELRGGITSQTVFPKTEDKLLSTEVQKSLDKVMKRKNSEKYRSLMDFIFCELFPEPWRWKCFKYYNGNGSLLIDDEHFTDAMAKYYDIFMSDVFIEICLQCLKIERWVSWSEAREASMVFLKAA